MSLSRTTQATAVGLAIVLATLGLAVQPANAAYEDCPDMSFCGWYDKQFQNDRQDTFRFREELGSFHDDYSSVRNRMDSPAWVSHNTYCGGHTDMYDPGESDNDLSTWWFDDNEEYDSVHGDSFYVEHSEHC